MKILIKIGHPAQVHLFKNPIGDLEKDGHIVKIVTKDKDVAMELLDAYGLKYEVISGYSTTMISKVYNFVKTDLKLLKIAIKNKPDILIAVGDPYVAHVGMLIKKPSIIFTDTEHAKLANKLTFPFTTTICTPSSFKKDLGKKQVRYNGYHELAYLHPNYFTPDPGVLDDLNLTTDDKFIIIRFVAWAASHDLGQFGISNDMKVKYISKLEQYGNVFISSESKLGKEFEKYHQKNSIHCSAMLSYTSEKVVAQQRRLLFWAPLPYISHPLRSFAEYSTICLTNTILFIHSIMIKKHWKKRWRYSPTHNQRKCGCQEEIPC